MTPQSQVRGAAVRLDVRSWSHPRHINQSACCSHCRHGLDPTGRDRAGLAHLVAASAALVEERHVPIARSRDALTFTVKPDWFQSENLVTDLREVGLEIARQREVGCIVPRP
jgi:hypothetical protein